MLEAAWPLARDAALRGAVAGFGRCASKMRLSMLFEAVDTLTAEYRRIGDGTLAASAPCFRRRSSHWSSFASRSSSALALSACRRLASSRALRLSSSFFFSARCNASRCAALRKLHLIGCKHLRWWSPPGCGERETTISGVVVLPALTVHGVIVPPALQELIVRSCGRLKDIEMEL